MTQLLTKPGWSVSTVSLSVAALVIALSIGSYLFFRAHQSVVVPENAIVLGVTGDEAAERSARFLRETFQQDAGEYQATTIWVADWAAKIHLEKELGVEQATALAVIAAASLVGWLVLVARSRSGETAPVGLSVQEEGGRSTAAAA